MIAPAKRLWEYRHVLRTTAFNDLRARYLGTSFGLVWLILYPLLFLGMYGTVYSQVLRIEVVGLSQLEYIQIIFCGLVPFIGFSEALSTGVPSVMGNSGLIRNTMFPIELISVKVVLTSAMPMAVSLFLLHLFLWSQGTFHIAQLCVPLYLGVQIVFSVGLIWLLSALTVFINDIAQLIGIVILFLMIVSPIAYTIDMVPDSLRPFLYPNPLFYMITLYRDAAFFGSFNFELFVIFSSVSVVMFSLGWIVFVRLKPVFSDYV